MQTHVQLSVTGCFAVLRQLRSIRRLAPSTVYQSLVVALVLSRLDYGNETLAGLPTCLLNRLQSVLNAASRSIVGLHRALSALTRNVTKTVNHLAAGLRSSTPLDLQRYSDSLGGLDMGREWRNGRE